MINRNDIEIMAPAGSWESLTAAIQGGADSVYFGVGKLNMRSGSAANFNPNDTGKIVELAHNAGVRAYLTLNTIIYDQEFDDMDNVLDAAAAAGIDAVIISDVAAMERARRKGLEVHISTQANISNYGTLEFYSRWADVAVLARELTLEQIKSITDNIIKNDLRGPSGKLMRVEMFAHGALCMAISGRCYLSAHDNSCSANRGACRQLCRRSYLLTDKETGSQIETDGQYLLSPKDLCTINFLDRFIDAGVRVLKIEGRARSAEYVKTVCTVYNKAVGAILDGSYNNELAEEFTTELATVFNRGFWDGYYTGKPLVELSQRYGSSATRRKVYVGKVTNYFKNIGVAEILVEAAPLTEGEELLFSGPTTGILEMTAGGMVLDDKVVEVIMQGTRFSMKTPHLVRRGDKLYKMVDAT